MLAGMDRYKIIHSMFAEDEEMDYSIPNAIIGNYKNVLTAVLCVTQL